MTPILITEDYEIDTPPLPGDKPPVTTNAPAPIDVSASADPTEEYIQQLSWGSLSRLRVLPPFIDELQRDFGLDIYDRMMDESSVSAGTGILLSGVFEQDGEVVTAVDDADPEYQDALTAANFCYENIQRIGEDGFPQYEYEMAEGGFTHGHQPSEIVYERAPSKTYTRNGSRKYMWAGIYPKPQTSVSFVTDPFGHLVGYLYSANGWAPLMSLPQPDPSGHIEGLLPPGKVGLFRYMERRGDLRGTSGLRSVYHAWWMLQQAYDDLRKFLKMFAVPPIWSTLPQNVQDQLKDAAGNVLARPKSPAQVQNDALKNLRSGGIATIGYGGTVNIAEPRNDGAAILSSITEQERRIVRAITYQEYATAGQGGNRAVSSVHQDMYGIRVSFFKRRFCAFVKHELFERLIALNMGPQYVHLTPDFTLGETEQTDFAAIGIAISRLYAAGVIQEDQLPEIFQLINLPGSDLINERIALKYLELAQQASAILNPPEPQVVGGNPATGGAGQVVTPPQSVQPVNPSMMPAMKGLGPAARSQRPNLRVSGVRGRTRRRWSGSEPGMGMNEYNSPSWGMPGNM